jgi:hypothetical protein
MGMNYRYFFLLKFFIFGVFGFCLAMNNQSSSNCNNGMPNIVRSIKNLIREFACFDFNNLVVIDNEIVLRDQSDEDQSGLISNGFQKNQLLDEKIKELQKELKDLYKNKSACERMQKNIPDHSNLYQLILWKTIKLISQKEEKHAKYLRCKKEVDEYLEDFDKRWDLLLEEESLGSHAIEDVEKSILSDE